MFEIDLGYYLVEIKELELWKLKVECCEICKNRKSFRLLDLSGYKRKIEL